MSESKTQAPAKPTSPTPAPRQRPIITDCQVVGTQVIDGKFVEYGENGCVLSVIRAWKGDWLHVRLAICMFLWDHLHRHQTWSHARIAIGYPLLLALRYRPLCHQGRDC